MMKIYLTNLKEVVENFNGEHYWELNTNNEDYIYFKSYTNSIYAKDIGFEIDIINKAEDEIEFIFSVLEEVLSYRNGFDVNYWINFYCEENVSGAPTDIDDITDDIKDEEKAINELYDNLYKYYTTTLRKL